MTRPRESRPSPPALHRPLSADRRGAAAAPAMERAGAPEEPSLSAERQLSPAHLFSDPSGAAPDARARRRSSAPASTSLAGTFGHLMPQEAESTLGPGIRKGTAKLTVGLRLLQLQVVGGDRMSPWAPPRHSRRVVERRCR